MLPERQFQARGVIRGLQTALQGFLTRLSTVPNQCVLEEVCHVTLPVSDWHHAGWVEQGVTASIAATSGTVLTLYTVPADRRAYLQQLMLTRATGDNTLKSLRITQPAGYGSGTRVSFLIQLTVAAAVLWWPNRSSTVDHDRGPTPVFLEPGATIDVEPGAAGVAVSTFDYHISLLMSPMIRARAFS